MATVTRYPSANNGGWDANESNAYADDGSYATTAPGVNSTESVEYGNFGFDALIPAGATINSVTLNAQWKVDTTASSATFRLAGLISNVVEGSEHTDTSEPTSDKTTNFAMTSLPTRDELLDGVFEVRVGAQRGSGSTGYTMSLDYVSVTVVYTVAYTITAAAGSFTLTGIAAGLKSARKLTAARGEFTLTGNDVTLTYTPAEEGAYTLTAAPGEFTLTGNAVTLRVGRKMTAASGSYTLTGIAAGLKVARRMVAAVGTFTLTGKAAALKVARKMAAASGAFVLTGVNTGLKAGRKITAAAGSFTLTGVNAGLKVARKMTATAGAYTLTGVSAALRAARKIAAAVGAFVLTGNDVTLTYAAAPVISVRGRVVASDAALNNTTGGDAAVHKVTGGDAKTPYS